MIITPLPLYHIFSLTANCLVFMSVGGENMLIPNPRDIPGFVKELAKYRFTAITVSRASGLNTRVCASGRMVAMFEAEESAKALQEAARVRDQEYLEEPAANGQCLL